MRISPVYINGFHQAAYYPCPEKNHMVAENNNSNEKASSEDKRFQRMCIFCLHSKRRLQKDNRQENCHHFQFSTPPNQHHHSVVLSPSPQDSRRKSRIMLWEKDVVWLSTGLNPSAQLLLGKPGEQYSKFVMTSIPTVAIPSTSLLKSKAFV